MSSITKEANAFMDYLIEEQVEKERMADPDYRAAMKEVEQFLSDTSVEWQKRFDKLHI